MKTIILTGFTSGLGLEMYKVLAGTVGQNLKLVCVGRNISRLEHREDIIYYEADMSSLQDWDSFIAQIGPDLGCVYFISNAAVIEPISPVGCLAGDQFLHANHINYVNPAMLVDRLVSLCERVETKLNITNISSGAAINAIAGWAAYCSTKAAFKMFLDVLAKDCASFVSVVHIDPGIMDTQMQQAIRSKEYTEMRDVGYFKKLHVDGELKSSVNAAIEILIKVGLV